jgi:hypothetical protein
MVDIWMILFLYYLNYFLDTMSLWGTHRLGAPSLAVAPDKEHLTTT